MAQTFPSGVSLRLAASPHVLLGDGRRIDLAPVDAALLAWLALEGPTPRQRLAALLWPDSDARSAGNTLRQRLFKLKKSIGEVVAGAATLALADGTAHDLLDADDVLSDVPLEPGDELRRWLQSQRERRHHRTRQSLADLAEMAERAQDWADALTHARELLALDPLSEEAHRRVMRLHYLAGDRSAALLAFDACERILKDEVGTTPGAATTALLETIQSARLDARAVGPQSIPASIVRPPRLVGRDRELSALASGWAAGRTVAVVGEAGLGKSRLLREFGEPQPGVVYAAARPGDAGVPFATLARLLRAALAQPAAPVLGEPVRGEIARVLPEFGATDLRLAGGGQRMALLRAVSAVLGRGAPLAGLMVDDLHFADEASLDLIGSLIDDQADAADAPRWALAWRPAETGSPVHRLRDALMEQARLDLVLLGPLDLAALAALVDTLGLPGLGGAALAPALWQRTGGNPLFVLETIKQAWVERSVDDLVQTQALPRPMTVERLIERRIAQLSPRALALARVVSIAGVDFDMPLAEAVLGDAALNFADALNELEAAQVLRGNAFAHDLVFDAVRASVPALIAAHTHAQVAAWLEAHDGVPARVARHWISAGRGARALPWLGRAAEAARRALRAKESIAFLETKSAIEAAEGQAEAAFESLVAAFEAFVDFDRDAPAGRDFCDRLHALARTPRQRVQARLQASHWHRMRAEFEDAIRLSRLALPEAEALGDPELRARAHHEIAAACLMLQRIAEAEAHLLPASAWYAEHGSDDDQALMAAELAILYDNSGRLELALPHHRRCIELSRRSGNLSNLAQACSNFACNRLDSGHVTDADHWLQEGQQALAACDDFGAHRGGLQLMRALALCQLGRYRQALAQAELALDSMRQYQPGNVDFAHMRLAWCWWHLGQWSRVAQQLAAVRIGGQTSLSVRVQHALLTWRAARAAGRVDATGPAREALHRLVPELESSDRADLRLPLLLELLDPDAPDEARHQVLQVQAHARRIGYAGIVLAAHVRAAAIGAAHDAAWARREALAALELAAQGLHSTSLLPAELWLSTGRAMAAAADLARADELFAQGRDWVSTVARDHVPEEFRSGFLERNPVNRALLASARSAPGERAGRSA